jgi:hypothetical protein
MLISLWAAAQAHITRKMMETLIGFGNSLIEINRLHLTHGTGGLARVRGRAMVTREPIVYYAYAAVLFEDGCSNCNQRAIRTAVPFILSH